MNNGQRLDTIHAQNCYYASNYDHSFHHILLVENKHSNLIQIRFYNNQVQSQDIVCYIREKKNVSLDECQWLNNNHLWQNANKSFLFPQKKSINQNILPVTSKHVVYAQSMKRFPSVRIVNITVHRLRLDCT